jgi:hypothetical protein
VSLWGCLTARGSLFTADDLLERIRATGVCEDPAYDAQNHGAKGLVAFLRGDFRALHGFDFWSMSGSMLASTLNACVELARPSPDMSVLLDEALRVARSQGAVVFERRALADLEAYGDVPTR